MSTAAPETAQRTYPAYSQPLWRRLLASREAAVVAMVLIVYFYGYSNIPYFGDTLTLTYILIDMTTILLIALPMTLVIITGEIDLSIASVVGLSSAVLGLLVQDGAPMGLAVLVALLVGVVCGVFNGFLVAYVGLPSLAVTIGTLALYRGIAVGLLGTEAVTDFPANWTEQTSKVLVPPGSPRSCWCSPSWPRSSWRCCTSRRSAGASTTSGSAPRPRSSPG